MPFEARQIDPAGSAQARLGAELRALRDARGLSQARLGKLIRFSPDLIRRVEATERFPAREFVEACDRALEADGALLGLWPAADQERRGTAPTRAGTGTLPPPRFDPDPSASLIDQWVRSTAKDSNAPDPSDGLWVTEDDIAVAEDTLRMFRQLDHAHGAGNFAAHLKLYLDSELATLLRRPPASSAVATARARVATGFFELAGYQAVDCGRPGWAQFYYGRALTLTAQAGDRSYGSYLVAANLAHLALHCGHPAIALQWAETAHAAAARNASPATRAAITAVVARAHARLGAERETTSLLSSAEELLDGADPGEEPPWIGYFNHGYLADEMAHCFHDLGHPPAARVQVADALGGVERSHVRRLAIDATLLASTWLCSGELEQACFVGREAVDFTARTASGRCVDRVAQFATELVPHAGTPVVDEFHDYVRMRLPVAARMLASSTAR
jgi:transcriptional regulator with XRE-family HTH domain